MSMYTLKNLILLFNIEALKVLVIRMVEALPAMEEEVIKSRNY